MEREAMLVNDTRGEIYARLAKVMKQVGPVAKGQTNTEQKYAFRGIDDVFDAIHKPMADNEVTMSFVVEDVQVTPVESARGAKGRHTILRVRYIFHAPDGSAVAVVTYGESVSYDDKGLNKALQAALKYALIQMFLIPVGEPEADHDTTDDIVEPVEWASTEEVDYLIEISKSLTDAQKLEAASERERLGIGPFKDGLPPRSTLKELINFVELLIESNDPEINEIHPSGSNE
jgi:hypothetical protein